jgi:hypothetical protein
MQNLLRLDYEKILLLSTTIFRGDYRMYHSDTIQRLVERAGLEIIEEIDHIGIGHTLFICE